MIDLPQVTLWASVHSDDLEYFKRTIRVVHYMQRLFKFKRTIMFSNVPAPVEVNAERIQIPRFDHDQFNIWVNTGVPAFIGTDFAMSVHEDGFVLDPSRWKKEFLDYDYIGAPWSDGVVGNGGFNIESQELLCAKRFLPFSVKVSPPWDGHDIIASDCYVCRLHRELLRDEYKITFAPRDLAMEFSTEQMRGPWPSLGFHGRNVVPHLYERGWKLIEESEKTT